MQPTHRLKVQTQIDRGLKLSLFGRDRGIINIQPKWQSLHWFPQEPNIQKHNACCNLIKVYNSNKEIKLKLRFYIEGSHLEVAAKMAFL